MFARHEACIAQKQQMIVRLCERGERNAQKLRELRGRVALRTLGDVGTNRCGGTSKLRDRRATDNVEP